MDPLEPRLTQILGASPTLMRVLGIARDLDLPDWRIVSGAVYQTVWNALTGRAPDYGIKDYDLVYFDGADLSYEAEDVHIRWAAAVYPADLSPLVEVRNQARVHLWFEAHFGEAYAPLSRTDEALERFVSPAYGVGVRLEADGRIDVAAPFGLEDIFAMRLRPNPRRGLASGWSRVTEGVRARWPEVVVEGPT
ncbi:MAG: nucleotidyltransferase family protein [Caulobacteraceae bacterium]|nr:nucleotidyltransferase family protein [Caulobacteraceae bacterium]